MNEKKLPFKSVAKQEYFCLGVVLFYIGFHGYINFPFSSIEHTIGYIDYVYWVRPVDGMLNGRVFGLDFFNYYGPLFSFIQIPFYYIFGANHWALLINIFIIFPLLSIVLAHFYIRIFIKTPLLRILFLIVCLFQGSIGLYSSIRHISAEITLGLFLFCLAHPSKRFIFFMTGVMQGISI